MFVLEEKSFGLSNPEPKIHTIVDTFSIRNLVNFLDDLRFVISIKCEYVNIAAVARFQLVNLRCPTNNAN
jgi:hypothetical protein